MISFTSLNGAFAAQSKFCEERPTARDWLQKISFLGSLGKYEQLGFQFRLIAEARLPRQSIGEDARFLFASFPLWYFREHEVFEMVAKTWCNHQYGPKPNDCSATLGRRKFVLPLAFYC